MDSQAMLSQIREKVEAQERLSAAEGEFLFRDDVSIHDLGMLADRVRRQKNADIGYYNLNAHLNPTNVCLYRCGLCAYSRDEGDPQAFVLTDDEIMARGREAVEAGCTELHIVGGVNPRLPFAWHREWIERLHATFPTLHLKAFTAVEIAWFAETEGLSVEAVLKDLMAAGLGSLPGGGAEIFAPAARRKICPKKATAGTWLAVHRVAHRLGLRSNATILYGHVESIADRIDHLLRLRELQDETGGFQALVPLAFHPANTPLASQLTDARRPTGLDDLRMVAVARLMLDNFDHIKAYWISLGLPTAQVALRYGADDLDGTVRRELIHHEAGSDAPQIVTVDRLRQLIREAGCRPVERDSLYGARAGEWVVASD